MREPCRRICKRQREGPRTYRPDSWDRLRSDREQEITVREQHYEPCQLGSMHRTLRIESSLAKPILPVVAGCAGLMSSSLGYHCRCPPQFLEEYCNLGTISIVPHACVRMRFVLGCLLQSLHPIGTCLALVQESVRP